MARFSFAGLQTVSDIGIQAANVGLSRIIAFIFLLLVFYYSSTLFWKVFYPQEFRLPVYVAKALTLKPQPKMQWRWFNDTKKVRAPKAAAQSKLNATLVGVISQGEGEGEGIALIALKGKASKIFRVGDEVTDYRVVKSIGADYVNLDRDGETEVLRIKKFNIFKDDPEEQAEGQNKNAKPSTNDVKAAIIKDPTKIMQYVRFEPHKSKQGEGFKLTPREDKHLDTMRELGLDKGDVVVSANGESISKIMNNPATLDKLLKGEVTLQVIRNGILTDVYVY